MIDQSDTDSTDRRRIAVGDFGRGIDYGPGIAKLPSARLCGTVIGTTGSYGDNPAATRAAAFDGRLDTFFDAPATNDAWTGLDLGPGHSKRVTAIASAPRTGGKFPERMIRGRFQGSNKSDFSEAVDLFTVTGIPKAGTLTTVNVHTTAHFRYLRYLSPDGGSANVAEIVFLGSP